MGLHESWGRAETPLNQTSGTPSWVRADHGAWKILLDAQDEARHRGHLRGHRGLRDTARPRNKARHHEATSWDCVNRGPWKILLDAQDETRHQGRPLGRVEIPLTERDQTPWGNLVELRESWGRVNCEAWRHRPTYGTRRHHGRPHEIAWSAARRTRQARQKRGYRDDDPRKQPSHETGRDAVCTATRSELNHPLRVLTVLRGELLAQDQQHPPSGRGPR